MLPLLSRLTLQYGPKPKRDRLFDFLCPGIHKSGTTWLHYNLKQHPQTRMPIAKELNYFNYIYRGIRYPGFAERCARRAHSKALKSLKGLHLRRAAHYHQIAENAADPTETWYRQVFQVLPEGCLTGEFTPDYFFLGEKSVTHIHQLAPDARIIILIREPVARMVSALSMGVQSTPKLKQTTRVQQDIFQSRADFITNIPIWDKVFGDQILYVPFGDIKSNPQAALRSIEAFIGLDPFDGYEDVGRKHNSQTGSVEIEPAALEVIERTASKQRAFLEKRFGANFCARI